MSIHTVRFIPSRVALPRPTPRAQEPVKSEEEIEAEFMGAIGNVSEGRRQAASEGRSFLGASYGLNPSRPRRKR